MSDMYERFRVILAIIGIVAVCKITYQVYQNKSNHTENHQSGTATTISTSQLISQNETGPMVYYANNPHGRKDCEYRFNYKKVGNTWRAYILRMPSLCGRDSDLHKTHRFTDGHGTYWVCWDTPVNSLKDMQAISRVWANSVQEYIATGKLFG